jgi:glucose-6-phosphate 1-dehydrogenase
LRERLVALDADVGADGRRLVLLRPRLPRLSRTIVSALASGPPRTGADRARKPIGHDLASARELDGIARKVFDEPQVFRIDHYLGKEGCRTILVSGSPTRWSSAPGAATAVDHVQITVAESSGIERRGRYYEEAGALRDMVQNHSAPGARVRGDGAARLARPRGRSRPQGGAARAVRPFSADELVRGSTRPAWSRDTRCPDTGTRSGRAGVDRRDVRRAARLDRQRALEGRSLLPAHGQAPAPSATEVAIVCASRAPLFDGAGIARLPAHHLALRIQPDEGISLVFRAKEPGPGWRSTPCRWTSPTGLVQDPADRKAYERLLHDAMAGDQTLFLREDAVERSWEIVAGVVDAPGTVHPYAAGTWGPRAADELIAPRAWRPS